jgi:ubiquinone/menaquinone biosynthesis C-methylase UbiE
MPNFHFVEDYEKLVAKLIRTRPIDDAISAAVGGSYEIFGQMESGILKNAGLRDGMRVIDLGCGSGRLASALHQDSVQVSYVGIDIIKALLKYAKQKAPTYEFILHRDLNIPQKDASADMVSAFSLFTHLTQAETYIYLEECMRVLKPGGKIVFSFLEFAEPDHWDEFVRTAKATKAAKAAPLNMFIERNAIAAWAGKLGLVVEQFVDSGFPSWAGHALGQSVVVLRKSGS